jgi:hypothetical protein
VDLYGNSTIAEQHAQEHIKFAIRKLVVRCLSF